MADNKQQLTGNEKLAATSSSSATNTGKTITGTATNITYVYSEPSKEIECLTRQIKQLELELKIKQLELEIAKLKSEKLVSPYPMPVYPVWPNEGTPVLPWYDPFKPWCTYTVDEILL